MIGKQIRNFRRHQSQISFSCGAYNKTNEKKKSKSGYKARLFAYNCLAVTHNDFRPKKNRTEYRSVVGDLIQENIKKIIE